MSTFVLVHGGWHGGWVWDRVRPILEAQGHAVHAPTLTGLGERQHLANAVTGPQTHVTDIVNLLIWRDLTEVILLGHSYAGLLITGVAAQVPERIRHLVYLDAFVPIRSGQGASTFASPQRAAEIRTSLKPDGMVGPNGFERWASDPEDINYLKTMTTPHPVTCFEQGVELTGRERDVQHRTNIYCAQHDPSPFRQFHDLYKNDPAWTCHTLPCLHDAMIEMPDALANLLLKADK